MLKSSLDNRRDVEKVYRRMAPVYDFVFESVFERGRKAVTAAAEGAGPRVLEAGVGTGISLPYYSENSRVVGVDLSEQMLEKARRRVVEKGLRNVEQLTVMDAERLEFPDDSFDAVAAVCVVNTAPNPELILEEFARVIRPGGEIVLFNRVGAERGPRRAFERMFQPITGSLGWRSDFPWDHFQRWIGSSRHDIHLLERRPMPPFGHFSLIRFGKHPAVLNGDPAQNGPKTNISTTTNT